MVSSLRFIAELLRKVPPVADSVLAQVWSMDFGNLEANRLKGLKGLAVNFRCAFKWFKTDLFGTYFFGVFLKDA